LLEKVIVLEKRDSLLTVSVSDEKVIREREIFKFLWYQKRGMSLSNISQPEGEDWWGRLQENYGEPNDST